MLRGEFIRKCLLLLAACLVLLLFVRDGLLSYTGVGLLMALFVLFVLENIVYQRRFIYGEGLERDTLLSHGPAAPRPAACAAPTTARCVSRP